MHRHKCDAPGCTRRARTHPVLLFKKALRVGQRPGLQVVVDDITLCPGCAKGRHRVEDFESLWPKFQQFFEVAAVINAESLALKDANLLWISAKVHSDNMRAERLAGTAVEVR